MPPLIIEASLALALLASTIRVTVAIGAIHQQQRVSQAEVMGEIKVIHKDLESLKEDNKELKAEVRENRKHRFTDKGDS